MTAVTDALRKARNERSRSVSAVETDTEAEDADAAYCRDLVQRRADALAAIAALYTSIDLVEALEYVALIGRGN